MNVYSDLQTIRSSIDSCTTLIWTLVDVGQLLSDNSNTTILLMRMYNKQRYKS